MDMLSCTSETRQGNLLKSFADTVLFGCYTKAAPGNTMKKRKGSARSTNTSGKFLEQCVHVLKMRDYTFMSRAEWCKEWKKDSRKLFAPEKYAVANYPYKTLYGTPGHHEFAVFSRGTIPKMLPYENGTRVVIECKWQDGSGSVDEKFPYVVQTFLEREFENMAIILAGEWWREGRGAGAVGWLRSSARKMPPEKRLFVCDGFEEWCNLARSW